MATPKSFNDLLNMKLDIPGYQRPYKWTIKNITDLLGDITNSIADAERYRTKFKYRIGTIIIHNKGNGVAAVVDGQQRIISLTLIKLCIDPNFSGSILKKEFANKITQTNIHNNYNFIRESLKSDEIKESFNKAFKDILEVVVISVEKVEEAFQLFDSQNTRGKELDPHDLLKAYHLREMKKYPYKMNRAVTKWEAMDTAEIRELFDLYLFRLWNWSRGIKSRSFTVKEIDIYKGIGEASTYSYARRTSKAMPFFQITEPFIAGNDFFEMVEHYIYLRRDIEAEIKKNKSFAHIEKVLSTDTDSAGFDYTKKLFYCALLCYYDKFHNFDEMAVQKIFTWAFMIRVDMESLGFNSINKYAIGDATNQRYSNTIAMFSKISFARLHTEIAGLQIRVLRYPNSAASNKWNWLYSTLKEMNGIKELQNE